MLLIWYTTLVFLFYFYITVIIIIIISGYLHILNKFCQSALQMISAVIQEDSYEVSLHINFICASPEGSRARNTPESFYIESEESLLSIACFSACVLSFSSRLLQDSRADLWHQRVWTSVLWQKEGILPVRVKNMIHDGAFTLTSTAVILN